MKSYVFLSAAFVILVSYVIWRYGPQLKIAGYEPFVPQINRLVAIMVVITLWGINNLFLKRAKPKQAEPEPKPEPVRDPVKERLQAFEAGFHAAMKKIQTKWQGGGLRSRSLYALPWYVLLGFSDSGKTSLVAEADLKFPLAHLFGQENFKNVEPTKDIDYWVTDNAVMFDLSGELTSQIKDPNENMVVDVSSLIWDKFHVLLNKYRPRRPINGVVLCINARELIESDDDVRANRAALIHARLVEMSEALGTRYTVHIVLTKFDLIDGFQEYFRGLSKAERRKPFGFSLEVYKEYDGDKWLEKFTSAYDDFSDRLNNDMFDRLSRMRDSEARRKVYTFVRQLTGMRTILNEFLRDALHQDLFSTPPLIRGVYFASTRQEGIPVNAVTLASSVEHDMRWPVQPAYSSKTQPHFSSALLQDAVFCEAGLAGDNNRVERTKKVSVAATLFLGSLAAVGFWAFYKTTFEDNQNRAHEILAMARTFVDEEKGLKDKGLTKGAVWVEPLNAISEAVNVFPDYKDKPSFLTYATLYQGKTIGPAVEKAYVKLLDQKFLPDVANTVQGEIVELGSKKKLANSDKRLEALRVYLMLGDKSKRDVNTVDSWMATHWQEDYEGKGTLQSDLNRHLDYAIDTASLEAKLNDVLVNDAQSELQRTPRDLRLYRNIENIASRQLVDRISFRNEIGPAFNVVMEPIKLERYKRNPGLVPPGGGDLPDLSISSFFSTKGYKDFFIPQNDSLSVVTVEDAWVTGERNKVAYSKEDLRSFKKRVLGHYSGNYIKIWSAALNALEITDFENIEHGVRVLEELTGPSKPLERLLGLVKKNSTIYEVKTVELDKNQAQTEELPFDDYREQGLRIERSFERLNAIVTPPNEGEKAYIEDLLTALTNLHAYMSEIPLAGDRAGQVALKKAKARIDLEGDDPIYIIERLSNDLPEPLDRFFHKIADQSWKVVLEMSQKEMQRAWNDSVYSRFNLEMASRFPFRRNSKKEVSLKDFTEFFGPKGLIDQFYEGDLAVFVDKYTGEPKIISGRHMKIDPEFVKQLQNSLTMQKIFFDGDGRLSLKYSLEPKAMSGNLSRALINIEGQLVPYSHGPRRPVQILWPNIVSGKPSSQLSLFASGGQAKPAILQYSGEWSGIRLLATARARGGTPNQKVITFKVGNKQVSYVVRVPDTRDIFFTSSLQKLALPAKL